jgi:hypothetical protein
VDEREAGEVEAVADGAARGVDDRDEVTVTPFAS